MLLLLGRGIVAAAALAYKFQPPRNDGAHTWEKGVSSGVHGRRVIGLIATLECPIYKA
jgi:hypothetical protein